MWLTLNSRLTGLIGGAHFNIVWLIYIIFLINSYTLKTHKYNVQHLSELYQKYLLYNKSRFYNLSNGIWKYQRAVMVVRPTTAQTLCGRT